MTIDLDKILAMKNVLENAKQEIVYLRRQNEILNAQVGVIEVFAAALGLRNNQKGMAIDVVWELQQAINSLESGS